MATLVFTIGGISATVTISNAKATELVGAYIDAHMTPDGPPVAVDATQTQKLTYATRQIAREFRDVAVKQIAKSAGVTAEAAALTEQGATDWS